MRGEIRVERRTGAEQEASKEKRRAARGAATAV